MTTMNRPDFAIAGVGTTGGGDFHRVELEGVSKVDGSLDCYSFKMNGLAKVKGSIRVEESFEASGKLTVDGSVKAVMTKIEGQSTIRGHVDSEYLQANGFVKIQGDCRTQGCDVRGAMTVDGVLDAERLHIYMDGPVRAEVIRAKQISIMITSSGTLKRLMKSILPATWQTQLRADHIEGDDIQLVETTATIVRGRRVKIGAGCVIDRVEFESELIVHPDAVVRSRERIFG
ncbi:polymer-forming cytoskeletal protein [Paenibacillus sp. CF384]|uniref:polymer-forming cytoskeletal protein n=1 Tax=Paenibacillus sp. CF384 TaxID=1884382 RepID=UPI0008948B07|nr:polymer-forming cytoskeletal protein [Paenibacillus sp. CF384]SDX44881.1 Polymer-forming protein [Paenibacillus sp. CF384]